MLAKDEWKVYTYGLENAKELKENKNIIFAESLARAVESPKIVLGGIPFTSNEISINTPFSEKNITIEEVFKSVNQKIFIAGGIKQPIENLAKNENVKIIDILKREELIVLNAISTSEGAIQIAMEQTARTIHGSKVLIMGFGRIGKILAKMLNGIGAKVYCEARKAEDFSWIKSYGYNIVKLRNLKEEISKFDIIINTIPSMILTKEYLEQVNSESLIIDVASLPGGTDIYSAKKLGIHVISALSLPGKVAPITSAEYIKETLYNILQEIEI